MFKHDIYGRFVEEVVTTGGFWSGMPKSVKKGWRFHTKIHTKDHFTEDPLEAHEYQMLLDEQEKTPMAIMNDPHSTRNWWMFQDRFYYEDEGYSAEEVRILALDLLARRERKIRNARSRLEQ